MNASSLDKEIKQLLGRLTLIERITFENHFGIHGDAVTLTELGIVLNRTEDEVRDICNSAIMKLKRCAPDIRLPE